MLENLLDALPEFRPDYEEHLSDYGEVLPHILMGQLFDFAKAAYERRDIVLLARIVDMVNKAAASDDEKLKEVVHASFIEYVPNSSINDAVKPLLNRAALAMYQSVVNFHPATTPDANPS